MIRKQDVSLTTVQRYIIMTMYEMQASHLFCFDYPFEKYFRTSMLEKFSEVEIDRVLDGTDFAKTKR